VSSGAGIAATVAGGSAAGVLGFFTTRYATRAQRRAQKEHDDRQFSGDIRTSEALTLWEAAEKIRSDLATELRSEREEKRRLEEENRKLRAEVNSLREEAIIQQREIAELQRLAGVKPRNGTSIERRRPDEEPE
jgi:hypothetical protein